MNDMTNTPMTETKAVHPFTAAGLGAAPFRYLGEQAQQIAYGQRVVAEVDGGYQVTTKAGGTCAYCGQYIVIMHNVRSADGKVFHVGSDCIAKVYGPTHKITRAARGVATAHAKRRTDDRIAACVKALTLEPVRAALAAKPHPSAVRAARGETLLDSVVWMMSHAGQAGKVRTATTVLAFVAGRPRD